MGEAPGLLDLERWELEMAKLKSAKLEYEDVRKWIQGRMIAYGSGKSDERVSVIMDDLMRCEEDISDVDNRLESGHTAIVELLHSVGLRAHVSSILGVDDVAVEQVGKQKLCSSEGSCPRGEDDCEAETIIVEQESIARSRAGSVTAQGVVDITSDPAAPNSCSTCGKLWHTADSCWADITCQWCNRKGQYIVRVSPVE